MPETFYSFILFVIIATATPGGATTLATASGVQFGFKRSIPLMLGIATGLAALAAAAASGLATLVQSLPMLEWTVRAIGTAYLLWLAIKIGSAGEPKSTNQRSGTPIKFAGGLLLLLLNPKGWAMALSAAASFAAIASDTVELAIIMASSFSFAAIASLSIWCIGGATLSQVLRSEFHWRIVNISLGILLSLSIIPMWLE